MSPVERTRVDIATLIAEVRDDPEAIDRLVDRLHVNLGRAPKGSDPDPSDVMATAGFLHHVYTTMESIHERVAAAVDGVVPAGER